MSTGRKILWAIALIAVMLVFGFSCGKDPDPVQRPIPSNILRFSDLSKQLDGHVLVKSTGARFTGTVSEVWPNGNQRVKISYKNGWQDGPARGWHYLARRGPLRWSRS